MKEKTGLDIFLMSNREDLILDNDHVMVLPDAYVELKEYVDDNHCYEGSLYIVRELGIHQRPVFDPAESEAIGYF